ncbi:MAG: YfcE family phosphodiesterase [Archaeoglobus sp.]|nr:MAG: YfcE family phosphodiesterase [Archaeoglobus sp.]
MPVKILAIGDTHIPDRASDIPASIKEFITGSYDILVFTGDLTAKSVLLDISRICNVKKIYAVRGNMDSLSLPLRESFRAGNLKFGVIHGHGIYPRGDRRQLESLALEMNVEVLITGHTHSHDIYKGKVLILNPGSATGVWGGGNASLIPSAMKLEVSGREVKVNLCLDGETELYRFSL